MKKITIKPRTTDNSSTIQSDRLVSKQAQCPLGKTKEPIASTSDWMREQEEIYKGLSNLHPVMKDIDDLVNTKPSYTHMKHDMGKAIVGVRGKD